MEVGESESYRKVWRCGVGVGVGVECGVGLEFWDPCVEVLKCWDQCVEVT